MPESRRRTFWSGVGVVLISTFDWLLFNQKLDAPAIVGMGLIVSGVVVLGGLQGGFALAVAPDFRPGIKRQY